MNLNVNKKVYRLVSKFNVQEFKIKLKQYREKKGLRKRDFGRILDRSLQQIIQYENVNNKGHFPRLDAFATICEILQADPKDLLCMKWIDVDNDPEPMVVYRYQLLNKNKKMIWICPKCKFTNIHYSVKEIIVNDEFNLFCESCEEFFNKLYLDV